ncbi:MAG TPA: OmpA family protein [Reyranella sp.]|nr:OmpA family protein [Reyranella sp.]
MPRTGSDYHGAVLHRVLRLRQVGPDAGRAGHDPQGRGRLQDQGRRADQGERPHRPRGTEAYNMALSLRRASAVKGMLVREGVPESDISVVALGEGQPMVPTADGVREAQNRRVEIVLR